jgi:hypothetical protein
MNAIKKPQQQIRSILFKKCIPIYIVCVYGLFYICILLKTYNDKNYFT